MKKLLAFLLTTAILSADPGIMVEIDVFIEQIANDGIVNIDGEQIAWK